MNSDYRKLISHLPRRAGFGANSNDIDRLEDMEYESIINELLDPPDTSWTEWDHLVRRFHHEQSGMISRSGPGEYWLYRMVTTPAPLIEKT